MNVQFQLLNVKTRLALAIMCKAHQDMVTPKSPLMFFRNGNYDTKWEKVADFYQAHYSRFSEEKIMETFKIAKRNGLKGFITEVPASSVLEATKYFHSSGVYEYEIKNDEHFKKVAKVARYALIIGGMFLGIQMPMDG